MRSWVAFRITAQLLNDAKRTGSALAQSVVLAETSRRMRVVCCNRSLGHVQIERGKIADLVLVDANPLEDISNVQEINAVIFSGKLIPESSLEVIRGQK